MSSRTELHPEAAGARVLALAFSRATAIEPAYLDLTLRGRDGIEHRLRFIEPRELRVRPPFPEVGWLQVLDISDRQWDGIGVEVQDAEMDEAISFLAERVVRIPSPAV